MCRAEPNPEYIAAQEIKKYERLGYDVAIYGYPLVMMNTYRQQFLAPKEGKFEINQFAHQRRQPTPLDYEHFANIDVLTSSAWLDVSREPLVLHIPPILKRYFLFEVFDGWTNCLATIDATSPTDWLISGPEYDGTPPQDVSHLPSKSSLVYIRGIIQCFGPNDCEQIVPIQAGLTLTPLSQYGRSYTPPPITEPASKLAATQEMEGNIMNMPSEHFFNRFGALTKANPPNSRDGQIQAVMAKIGIKETSQFDIESIPYVVAEGITASWGCAREEINCCYKSLFEKRNHWTTLVRKEADFGRDYTRRALFARASLPTSLAKNRLTFTVDSDKNGIRFNGWRSNSYVLRFKKKDLALLGKLWSVTLVSDTDDNLVINPINRYAIQSFASSLQINPDGCCDILIQHAEPVCKLKNWLPCPRGNFVLILRCYQPDDAVVDGCWCPPDVVSQDLFECNCT